MKKFLTLVAAALMAVGVNAQTEDVIKVSSGNSDWGQMFVNDGVAFEWPGRTFESTDKLTAKALYAGCNLKDSEDKDLTYARESGSVQTYTIEFGATPTVKLQICVNCIIPNQYGGGHSTMKFKPLTIVDNKASFTVSKEDCSFTGWSFKKVVEGETEKYIEDKEYKNEPQDVTSIVLQACDANATYPAVINIKSIKRVTTTATDIPRYTLDLANLDFSTENAKAIGGWGKGFHSEIKDGVDVITFTKQEQPHEVQVDFENVYPKGAKIQLTMVAKGSVAGSINAVLQNPDNYHECSNYEDINLATDDFKSIEKTFTCSGDNARRLLLNVGNYDGEIDIKSVKIVALDVPEETVTISSSGYSTYAAYYPVDYSKLDDLKAYTVILNAEKTGIVMNEVKCVVPAGVAVLLKGKADTDYALTKAEGWQNVTSDLKMSDGTITSTDKKTVYGLATVDGQDGFYRASKGKTIPVKCAYLEVENSASSAKCFSLGDHSGSTTGITSVKNEAAGNNAPMYNLAGQLVDKGYKGIVIKNGKKIVLK
ncbi:hypothetical protein ONT15_14095 [Prevotella copri]|uniref:Uncharacterized protein n=1 Tax=Segatella copri TaxID=165179 RepID=A0AAW5U3A9_9BACT|nr:hypothetical protein [Segatella copri]MCW4100504.1 hypothetical protein [Segatella copri]MCW4132749.1 hypothetical protein [Segatella copri]MCW4163069.1 hypothetical protein [Segatella copri]